MNETRQKVLDLKAAGTDHEYYPTTNEILHCIQNGNLHVKIKKELIKAWNFEVGKLKNWLHEPEDVAREFDVSMEEAAQMWNGSSLQLINKTSPLLIGFGG